MLKTLTTLAAATLLASPLPAFAGPAPITDRNGTIHTRVSGSNLNLASAAGQGAMRERVEQAVGQLCDMPLPVDYVRNYSPRSLKSCRTLILEAAEPQLRRLFAQAEQGGTQAALRITVQYATR